MRQPGRIARTFIAATCAAVALAAVSAGGAGITALPGSPATPDNLSSQQWNLEMIGAFQAQTITGGSPDVRVALIDSGIDPGHPEFAGRIDMASSVSCITGSPVKDPTGALWRDNVGHGTHVAGLIAAGDNEFGTVGVAPNVQLLIVKVTDPGLPITPQAAACAFEYVSQQNVDVANASFAVDKGATGAADALDFFCRSDPADRAAIQSVGDAVKDALRSGTTIVASAGNNGIDMNFGRWSAAISVPLYPETVLCEESASIGCARVMRGIESIENAVTRRSARARTRSPFTSGCRKAMRI